MQLTHRCGAFSITGSVSNLDVVLEDILQCERRPVVSHRNFIEGFCGLNILIHFHINLFSCVLRGRGNDCGIQTMFVQICQ